MTPLLIEVAEGAVVGSNEYLGVSEALDRTRWELRAVKVPFSVLRGGGYSRTPPRGVFFAHARL